MEPASRRRSYKREKKSTRAAIFQRPSLASAKLHGSDTDRWMKYIHSYTRPNSLFHFFFLFPTPPCFTQSLLSISTSISLQTISGFFFPLLPLTRPQARSLLCKNSLPVIPEPPRGEKRQTNKMSRHLNILDERGYSNTQSAHEKRRWNQIPWVGRWTRIKFSS